MTATAAPLARGRTRAVGAHDRIPALDGVRGLAVLAVVLEHGGSDVPRGGGLAGVTIFFVLSGFLITRLLIAEHARTGTISLAAFWLRRAVRLLPALWVFLAVTTVVLAALRWTHHGVLTTSVPVFLYYADYSVLAHPLDQYGHLWSLSVEEQFYLVWPLLTLAVLRLPRAARLVPLVAVAAAGVLVRLLVARSDPGGLELVRTLHANFWGLGVGAVLAAAVDLVPRRARLPWPVSLLVAAVGLDLLPRYAHTFGLGWFDVVTAPFVAGTVAVVLIVAALGGTGGWLSWPVLTWLGRRSYAWYLWHFPFVWTAVGGRWSWHGRLAEGMLSGALGLVCAELSWWLVERPSQRLFRRWQRRRRPAVPDGAAAVLPRLAGTGTAGPAGTQ